MPDAMVELRELYELAGYVKTISNRADSLGKSATGMESNVAVQNSSVSRLKKKTAGELSELKAEISELKDGVREVQKAILLMISEMKNTLKRDDFERFEKRIDLWSPENLVSRREVRRLIRKV